MHVSDLRFSAVLSALIASIKCILGHVPMDTTRMLVPAKKNAQIIFILTPKVR